MNRQTYMDLILQALHNNNGSARIWEVSKFIWENSGIQNHEKEEFFYNWQYEVRWAANNLRRENKINSNPRGYWTLTNNNG